MGTRAAGAVTVDQWKARGRRLLVEALHTPCTTSTGATFALQRMLEGRSLRETIRHFGSGADEETPSGALFTYWQRPAPYGDAMAFLTEAAWPICIVSDIDRAEIEIAMSHFGIQVDLVVTSEDARAYKPRPEPFRLALDLLGQAPDQVLHVGDSLTCDVGGANALDIPVARVNRTGRQRPPGTHVTCEVPDLTQLAELLLAGGLWSGGPREYRHGGADDGESDGKSGEENKVVPGAGKMECLVQLPA